MKRLLLFLFIVCSVSASAQIVNNTPWYEYSKKLGVGKLQMKRAGEYSTSFTIPNITASVALDTITEDRTVTFPDLAMVDTSVIIYVFNSNSSAFVWNVIGNVRESETGDVIESISRGLHVFIWTGSYWARQKTGGGSTPATDTNTVIYPITMVNRAIGIDPDGLPVDTCFVAVHNDSLFNVCYFYTGVRDSTFVSMIGGSVTAANGLRMDGDTVKLANEIAGTTLTENVELEGHTNLVNIRLLAQELTFDPKVKTLFQANTNDSAIVEMKQMYKTHLDSVGDMDATLGKSYAGATLGQITANRTIDLQSLALDKRGVSFRILNLNNSAFTWNVSQASSTIVDEDGSLVTEIADRITDFVWDGVKWVKKSGGGGGGGGITALTGDVTASGSGSVAATIANHAVTDAKFRQSDGLSIIGRSANFPGDVADITAGTDGHVLRRSGTSIGFGTIGDASISDLAYSKLTGTPTDLFVNNGNSFGGTATLGTNDNNNLVFEINNTEKMRINTSSQLLWNTTSASQSNIPVTLNDSVYMKGLRMGSQLTGSSFGNPYIGIKTSTSGTSEYALNIVNALDGIIIRARADGQVSFGSTTTFTNSSLALPSNTYTISTSVAAGTTGNHVNWNSGTTNTATSSTVNYFSLWASGTPFAPTSGTAVYNTLNIGGTINQTGGANGVVRGAYINQTLTSAPNYRAIEVTAGNSFLGTTSGGLSVGATTTMDASAVLQATSTTQGFLPPKMTATQASAIASPAEGLMVYVTNTNGTFTAKGWWGYDGTNWLKLNN